MERERVSKSVSCVLRPVNQYGYIRARRESDRKTDRDTDRHRQRRTDRQTRRDRERQTDRDRERDRDGQKPPTGSTVTRSCPSGKRNARSESYS